MANVRLPKEPMNPSPLLRSLADLFWTFFPVLIVLLVLAILGKLEKLFERTDLILAASVLFAEGWSRSSRVAKEKRGALQFVGFIGALATAVVGSMMLMVEAGGITQLSSVVQTARFSALHVFLLVSSVLYGLVVRLTVYSRVDFLSRDL